MQLKKWKGYSGSHFVVQMCYCGEGMVAVALSDVAVAGKQREKRIQAALSCLSFSLQSKPSAHAMVPPIFRVGLPIQITQPKITFTDMARGLPPKRFLYTV